MYLARKAFVPFAATVAIAAALLILERMLRLFDFVITENGPAVVVWKMLGHLMPHYLSLALPVGLFLGCMLAIRSLSLSSELDAMAAGGASLSRLLRPLMALAAVLAAVNLALVGYIQPFSRYAYRNLSFELSSGAFGASIRTGDFVSIGEDVTLRVGAASAGGRELGDIFLHRAESGAGTLVASADRGAFFAAGDARTILLRLYDGRLVHLEPGQRKPRVLHFASHDLSLDLPQVEPFRGRGGEELELTLTELARLAGDPALEEARARSLRANFHLRLIQVLTFMVLPLLAVSMGLSDRRTGSASGLVLGLSLLIVYNELLEAAERQGAAGAGAPGAPLWGLFAGFAALALISFGYAAFRPGRGPMAALDRRIGAVTGAIKRAFKRLRGTA